MRTEELRYVGDMTIDVKSFLLEKGISKPNFSPVEEWLTKDRITEADKIQFYESSQRYIYTLLWLSANRYHIRDCAIVNTVKNISTDYSSTILDYGCGLGNIAFKLALGGYHVTFADLDTLTFEFVKWRCKKYNVEAEFITLPQMIQKSFDMIICLEVLEHLDNPKEILARFRAMLKDEGKMLISEAMGKSEGNPLHVYQEHSGREILPTWMNELGMKTSIFFDIWEPIKDVKIP